jgi:hypothetical protein
MANVIEIRIKGSSDTDAVYAAETAKAAAAGRDASAAYSSAVASHLRGEGGTDIAQSLAASVAGATGAVRGDAGKEIADEITDSISDTIGKDLPPKIQDPFKRAAKDAAPAFVSGFQADLGQSLAGSAIGDFAKAQGQKFTASFSQGAKTGIADANLGGIIGDALGAGIEDAVPADVLGPDSPAGEKIREGARKTGQQAGKEAGEGMGPLLTTAIAGGLSVGAPLILGAFGGVMAGVTTLALKNNAVIKQDFADLGTTASSTLSQAVAPAAGTLNQALVTMQGTVKGLEPQLQGLFVNAEPDITAVAGGVSAFATNVLPGLSSALANSQGIVADLGQGLGSLGSGVGGMFQGLTRDAYTTGAGMESLLDTTGHLASTLGSVLGSAASVGSTALMGLDPVLNTTLSLVQKIASPGVVGAGAGLFAAFKLDPSISSGLTSAAGGVETLALKTMEATSSESKMGGALAGTASALRTSASVMSGPWGMAIGGAIGLATGLVGSLINASHASDALKLSQQGLQDAISKDGGSVGTATAAYVAAQEQANGLAQAAAGAGVSLDTLTEASLGNGAAQDTVTAAIEKANQAQRNQQLAAAQAAVQSTNGATSASADMKRLALAAAETAASNNTLTDSNAKVLNSMKAQAAQTAAAIAQQQAYENALNNITNSYMGFTGAMASGHAAMVASAQQSALNTVSSLTLGNSTFTLGTQLYNSVSAFNAASAGAQAYSTVLQALNGTTMNLDNAQNTLAQQMLNAKTAFAQNKYSLDLSTQAGINNRQALTQAAQAIQQLGDAEEQKTGSISDANAVMKKQEDAFIAATGATGKAKTAIQQYIDELLQIPSSETTVINRVYTTSDGTVRSSGSGGRGAKAAGGVVSTAATGGNRDGLVQINEAGQELARFPNGTTIIPRANVESMAATGQLGGASFGPVQLELLPSGGSPLEQMIWDWLRGRIAAKGGGGKDSVQRALGQVA